MTITATLRGLAPALLLAAWMHTGSAADAPAGPSARTGAAASLPPPPPGMFAPPGRAITHVKGDLYRANNGGWYVAILDTPEGLLLVDTTTQLAVAVVSP